MAKFDQIEFDFAILKRQRSFWRPVIHHINYQNVPIKVEDYGWSKGHCDRSETMVMCAPFLEFISN